jgi:tubulin polyglutamylase TTLL6/13
MQKISVIVVKTVIAALPAMQNGLKQCKKTDPNACFQLLGFDVILNDRKEPLLLEVNQNPSLNADTPFDHKLKFTLVKNILEMVTGGYRCTA